MVGEEWMSNILSLLVMVPFLIWASIVEGKDLGKYGQTFPIKEMDIIEYIQGQLKHMEQTGELAEHQRQMAEKTKEQVQKPSPVSGIKHTEITRSFIYDPTYRLQEDIRDHSGNIIHKSGTEVNPLDTVSWGADILFIDGDDERQVSWAIDYRNDKGERDLEKKVIVLVKGEPIALEEKFNTRIYFDQGGNITKQLGIKQVPAEVVQKGKYLSICEVKSEVGK